MNRIKALHVLWGCKSTFIIELLKSLDQLEDTSDFSFSIEKHTYFIQYNTSKLLEYISFHNF